MRLRSRAIFHIRFSFSLSLLDSSTSELVSDPRGEVVDVLAGWSFFEERPGEEVDIAGQHRDVASRLPCQREGRCTANITGSAQLSCAQKATGESVDTVIQALPPKEAPVCRGGHIVPEVEVQDRMHVDQVLRSRRVLQVIICCCREQWVEGLEICRSRIPITTGNVGPKTEAGTERQVREIVMCCRGDPPCLNGARAKLAELRDEFDIVFPWPRPAPEAGAHRVAKLVPRTLIELSSAILVAKVVEIRVTVRNHCKGMDGVNTPQRALWV